MSMFFLILLPLAIPCFCMLLTLIVTMRERHYVWILEPFNDPAVANQERREPSSENPYQPPTSPSPDLPLTTFAATNCGELESLGYLYLESFRHMKRGIYQIRYDAWISADRYVLAFVESGSLMTIRVNNLSLMTLGEHSAESRNFRSAGSAVCVESFTDDKALAPNIGGLLEVMLFRSASASDADRMHRQRLAFFQPRPFSEDPLRDYQRLRIQEAQAGCEQGRCRFVDEQQNVWLPTLSGALRIYFHMYAFMLSRRVYSDRWRLRRMIKRRGTAAETAQNVDPSQRSQHTNSQRILVRKAGHESLAQNQEHSPGDVRTSVDCISRCQRARR